MRSFASRILIAFVFVTLVGTAAFAKSGRVTITFASDTKVNDIVLEKGTYDIKFDDKSGELSVLKNGKEVAKAATRTEKRDRKADRTEIHTANEGGNLRLTGVAFSGSDMNIVIT